MGAQTDAGQRAGVDRQRERWHVGKEVPLALIVAMMMQTASAVWWARGRVAKEDEHERRIALLEKEREVARIGERMAVLEATITEIRRSNERTEALLQQVLAGKKP